jgi:hypothetical protein
VAGVVPYQFTIDVDELAGTTYHAEFYTRETETDGWWSVGGLGAEAADTDGHLTMERYRYVKVVIDITGGEFPSGVIGY